MSYARYFKRPLDFLLACILIALLAPILIFLMVIYVLTISFPFFYRQQRIGMNGKTFSMIKFRSLKKQGGSLEDRRFLLGDWIRFISLDELPQLFNVVAGDMSLIGPRPLPAEYLPLFSVKQRGRHRVRPGITGWAQVNGRNSIEWSKKFELDNYYIDHLSAKLDLYIAFKTVIILFSFRRDDSLKEEKFMGN